MSDVILLVEDNPRDIDLTLRAFEKNNIKNDIVIARDGEEALDYLFGIGEHEGRNVLDLPHLVLLDLKLPKVDGFEVLNAIRSDDRTKLLPVVILTTSNEQRDRIESYTSGANSYVQKPVDFMQFNEAIKELGLYWLVLNLPPLDRKRPPQTT